MGKWIIKENNKIFEKKPWITIFQEEIMLPNGKLVDDYYTLKMPNFSVIIAKTIINEIIMVRGYKHGVCGECLQFPAGMIEDGESAEVAAKRELLEETGYGSDEWMNLGNYTIDGNRYGCEVHYFFAKNAYVSQQPKYDEMEEVTIELMTDKNLLDAYFNNEINILPHVGAIGLAALNNIISY